MIYDQSKQLKISCLKIILFSILQKFWFHKIYDELFM